MSECLFFSIYRIKTDKTILIKKKLGNTEMIVNAIFHFFIHFNLFIYIWVGKGYIVSLYIYW